MLEIDIDLPELEVKKAVKATSKTSKSKKKGKDILHLGDERRLAKAPEIVDTEFLDYYRESLDAYLQPYVATNRMSVAKAHRYAEAVVVNVFGNNNHMGIFHYLKDKNFDNKSDKDLVVDAEKLLVRGWHVREEGRNYWLYNGDFNRVVDISGKSNISKSAESLIFDAENAHIFFEDKVASKVQAVSSKLGYNADQLAEDSSLDLLLANIAEPEFAGYILNYNALRNILEKKSKYKTMVDGLSMTTLYEEGFRLDSHILTDGEKAILEDGSRSYILYPVRPEINQTHVVNKSLISVISSNLRQQIYGNMRTIVPQEVHEIKELRHTFALLTNHWETDAVNMSYVDVVESLRRLKDSGRDGFSDKVFSALSAIIVTEAIILGNRDFNFGSIGFDSVSGKFYVYTNENNFTNEKDDLSVMDVNYDEGASGEILDSFTDRMFPFRPVDIGRKLSILINSLPAEFISGLSSTEFNPEGYPIEFTTMMEYFNTAKGIVLEKAGKNA